MEKPAYFGCVDLKYNRDGKVRVLEIGDGHTSGFTGSGAFMPRAFQKMGYGRQNVTPVLDAVVENKALTHFAFVNAGFGGLRPASVVLKRTYEEGLANQVLEAVGGGHCVLKLLDRQRGCGIVAVSPDQLDATLRALLCSDTGSPAKASTTVMAADGKAFDSTHTAEWAAIADAAAKQNGDLAEQVLHWKSDECPFFLAEALCESHLVIGRDGELYDGTLRVGFALESNGKVKPVGAYWKLPDTPAKQDVNDLSRSVVSHTHGGTGTIECNDEDLSAVWEVLEGALTSILDLSSERFTVGGLLEQLRDEPLMATLALSRVAAGLTVPGVQDFEEADEVLLLAEKAMAAEEGLLARMARSYVLRTRGTVTARRRGNIVTVSAHTYMINVNIMCRKV